MIRSLALALTVAVALTSCASHSHQSRDERAYAKYVQKQSGMRVKQQAKLSQGKSQMPPPQLPSEPVETTSTGPESVSSDSEQ